MIEINPTKDEAQIAASRCVLEESAKEGEAYSVTAAGQDFVVLPGVFSPKYFGSTHIFARLLPIQQGDLFLEVGSGTGILSVIAAQRGAAHVVAIDINPLAVQNTIANARLHHVDDRVDAREGDVFSSIGPDERFDAIFWNMPFIYVDDNYVYQSMLERSLFDPGYRLTERFLAEGRRLLRPRGRLLVGFGDFGDVPSLETLACAYGFPMREIGRGPGTEGGHVTFILYELKSPRSNPVDGHATAGPDGLRI